MKTIDLLKADENKLNVNQYIKRELLFMGFGSLTSVSIFLIIVGIANIIR